MEKKIIKLYVYKAISYLGSYFYEIKGGEAVKFLNFPENKENVSRFSKSERQKIEEELAQLITAMCQPATGWLKEKSTELHELSFEIDLVFSQEFKIRIPTEVRKGRTESSVVDESKPYRLYFKSNRRLYVPVEPNDALLFLNAVKQLK